MMKPSNKHVSALVLIVAVVFASLGIASPAVADEPKPAELLEELLSLQEEAAGYETNGHGWCNSLRRFDSGGLYSYRPAINGGTTHCILARGAGPWNHGVVALQMSLFLCYKQDTGGYDGDYGPKTEAAVKHVQRVERITVDGVYGPQTERNMQWVWFNQSNNPQTCRYDTWV